MALVAIALVALAVAATDDGAQATGRDELVFASDRRAALVRPAIYAIRTDGRGRRRVSSSLAGADALVPAPRGGGFAFLYEHDLHVARGSAVRRLTHSGRIYDPPAWSPDGSWLAYYQSRGVEAEETDLLVIRADGRGRRVLSRSRGRLFGAPAWSPDGRQLVAEREVGLESRLTVLEVEGGREHRLTAGSVDSDPAWSPDGRLVAFTRTWGNQDDRAVFTVDVRSRTLREIAHRGDQPAWSPDGRRIAYHLYDGIHILSRRGGLARRVARTDSLMEEDWPWFPIAWSPDSRELAILIRGEVWAIRADGRGRRQVTRERPRSLIVSYPVWAGRIAFLSKRREPHDRDVFVIGSDGRGIRELTRNDLDEDEPTWAPDGRRIAFTRYRQAGAEVVVLDATGGSERVVATGADPAWSPDGKRLAFSEAVAIDGELSASRIVVIGSDGSGRAVITEAFADYASEDPAWSPDGALIAFAFGPSNADPPSRSILVVAPVGGPTREVVSGSPGPDIAVSEPVWAPDGRRLAFVRTVPGTQPSRLVSQLAIRDLDVRRTRVLYAGPGSVSSPAWRPRSGSDAGRS